MSIDSTLFIIVDVCCDILENINYDLALYIKERLGSQFVLKGVRDNKVNYLMLESCQTLSMHWGLGNHTICRRDSK